MNHLPPELRRLVIETDRVAAEIRNLKSKKRLPLADLRQIACHKARLLQMCPPERYAWIDGFPVADILKTLHQQEVEKEIIR